MSPDEIQKLISELAPLATTWVLRIAGALVGFLLARWAARVAASLAEAAVKRSTNDAALSHFLGQVVRWSIFAVAVISILGVFGVETTSFAAAVGAAGLAVGLAFQGSLSNVASGVMLLVFRPFKVGDVITVVGQTGGVTAIGLMATTLDTADKRRFIIPNSSVFGSVIENMNAHDVRRVDVAVGTEYSADLNKTREVLEQAISDVTARVEDPKSVVYLLELGGSSINWSVRVYVPTAEYWSAREQLTQAVKTRLDAAGIGIPFPQMDVHLDGKLDRVA